MTNAQKVAPVLRYSPSDPEYCESSRRFQGCPTVAVTRGGRIFLGWYSGGTKEPHIDNYNLIVYSEDGGENWSKPYLVIPGSREHCIHALDIQLWLSPTGALHVFWVQNHVDPTTDGKRPDIPQDLPWIAVDGYSFGDFEHSMWMCVCTDPDAPSPVFDSPRRVDKGFLRCKPTALPDGTHLFFNYDQLSDCYGYSLSTDNGMTFSHRYGAKKVATPFDEAMAYVMQDGSIRMLARTERRFGFLAESISRDGGMTWSEAVLSNIPNPSTRFFISRLPSGRVLLVNNDSSVSRTNMTLCLSEDDGRTWKYKRVIDTRPDISYPDCDFFNGRIFLTYDRERTGAKEICFLDFCEEDVIHPDRAINLRTVSKP